MRHAGDWSGGLVDATLSRPADMAPPEEATTELLREALAAAPPRRVARRSPAAAWHGLVVDDARGIVRRPPGVRLAADGIARALAVDAALRAIIDVPRALIECGGATAGFVRSGTAWEVAVEHPLTEGNVHAFRLRDGALADAAIRRGLSRRADGTFGHGLLDPATAQPAWTGVVSATALARTAVAAEIRAAAALLAGLADGRALLRADGGLLVDEAGSPWLVPAAPRPTCRRPPVPRHGRARPGRRPAA